MVRYFFVVVIAACVALVFELATTTVEAADLITFGALVGCTSVCVEAMRRLGMPAGISRDLLGAWWLPAFLLLPPLYALLIPIPIYVLHQVRVRRTLIYRRVFNAATVALAGYVTSTLSRLAGGGLTPNLDGLAEFTSYPVEFSGQGLLTSIVCGALFTLLDTMLIITAVRLSAPETSLRELLWDREDLLVDTAELCMGIMVTILCGLSLILVVIALPSVLLLHRSLLFQQLQTAARTDPKTGLLNATTWQSEAEAELSRALQVGRSMAVLILDIDHFKRVNDTYGHLFGDQVLAGVANTITHQLRQSDVVGRFGGEEFVVLLPDADMAEACRVAERLRSRVGRMALPVDETTVTITISVGVALLAVHGRDLIELMAAADLALYRAKDAGRDRVCMPVTSNLTVSGPPDTARRRGPAARELRGRPAAAE
ncbi:GGDEF domain-containing protein [Marinactinospora rubrisoli]|uniref:GGDEF domain-containing protein n=1 Tax=Marinactinospora rubrisoli TaxID=2715399 RepID=A0ABW2KHJ4_9ACTN